MEAYLFIDGILVITIAVIVLRCWYLGMVASLISLMGKVVSYITAIYDGFLRVVVVNHVESKLPPEVAGFSPDMVRAALELDGARVEILEKIEMALHSIGLSSILPSSMMDATSRGDEIINELMNQHTSVSEAIVDTFIQPVAILVMRIFVFSIIFAFVSVVVGVIFKMGREVNRIPVIGGLNHLLGGCIGVVCAGIVCYIICMLLSAIVTITTGSLEWLNWQILDQTTVFNWIIHWKMPFGITIFDLGVV